LIGSGERLTATEWCKRACVSSENHNNCPENATVTGRRLCIMYLHLRRALARRDLNPAESDAGSAAVHWTEASVIRDALEQRRFTVFVMHLRKGAIPHQAKIIKFSPSRLIPSAPPRRQPTPKGSLLHCGSDPIGSLCFETPRSAK
jgi:hypothetical protein